MWNRDSLETRDERRREVYSRKSFAAQVPDARDLQDDFIDAGVAGVPGGYFATPDKQDELHMYTGGRSQLTNLSNNKLTMWTTTDPIPHSGATL